jgi:hypothetical protein
VQGYVGQTGRPLKERINGHRATFHKNNPRPLYAHFRKRNHTFLNVKATVLQSHISLRNLLLVEKGWIAKLDTMSKYGLNDSRDPH